MLLMIKRASLKFSMFITATTSSSVSFSPLLTLSSRMSSPPGPEVRWPTSTDLGVSDFDHKVLFEDEVFFVHRLHDVHNDLHETFDHVDFLECLHDVFLCACVKQQQKSCVDQFLHEFEGLPHHRDRL